MTLQALCQNMHNMISGGISWRDVREDARRVSAPQPCALMALLSASLPQVLVFIVADGRDRMSKSALDYCEHGLGVYHPGMLTHAHQNNEVTCHIFQRTVFVERDDAPGSCFEPIQLVFAMKEKNGGKLNSHLWFFGGFLPQIQPAYVLVRPRFHLCACSFACVCFAE